MSARVNRRIGEAEELWLLLAGHQDLTHSDDCDCLMRGVAVVLGVSGLLALACVGRAHGHPHAVGRDPGGLMEAVLAVHDEVRGAANLPRLNWSDALARRAAQWAAHLAARQLVAHSGTNMAEGENIWVGTAGAFSYELMRSEEHTSELQSLMRISYAVFCLKKKNTTTHLS